jgi:TetR/AcrR family transcriptional repressor of nem operon
MSKQDTKMKMINAPLELFHVQGVNATSVDQILLLSGTGKSQFSHYFKTKEGLVHAVLQFLHDQAPTGYMVKNWKDLENWFQKMTEFALSCPIGTIGNDISNDLELLRQDVYLFLEWARSELSKFFSERKAKGELKASVKPESLADFCISLMQGGMLLTKIKRDPEMFENAAKEAMTYIKSLRISKKIQR